MTFFTPCFNTHGQPLVRPLPRFTSAEGDLVTFLNVWRAWHEADRSKRWCGAHFLNYRNLLRAADIRRQLEFALRCAAAIANPEP